MNIISSIHQLNSSHLQQFEATKRRKIWNNRKQDHLCWKAYEGSTPIALNLIKETDKLATVTLELAHSNTELITDNSEKISKQDFQTEEMSN